MNHVSIQAARVTLSILVQSELGLKGVEIAHPRRRHRPRRARRWPRRARHRLRRPPPRPPPAAASAASAARAAADRPRGPRVTLS